MTLDALPPSDVTDVNVTKESKGDRWQEMTSQKNWRVASYIYN